MANEITITVSAKDQASGVIKGVQTNAGGLGKALGDVSKIAAGFVIGNAIPKLGGFLFDAAQAAAEDQRSMERLQQAVNNTGQAFADYSGELQGSIERAQKRAFTDDQARNSLSLLVAQTNDTEEAMKRFSLAQDVARGAGIDLETASRLLGKVTAENVEVFKRMGITIGEGATEAEAFAELQRRFGGQADAYANSTAGQFEVTKIKMGELKEQIGYALLPIMTELGNVMVNTVIPAMEQTVAYIEENFGPTLDALMAKVETEFVPGMQEQWAILTESTRTEWAKFMPYYQTEIQPALQAIQNRIDDLIKWTRENWALIEPIIRIPLELALVFVNHAVSSLTALFDIVIQLLQGDFSEAWKAVVRLIEAQLNFGIGLVTYFKDTVIALFGGLAAGLVSLGGLFLKAGNDLLERFFAGAMGQAAVMLRWAGTFPAQIWHAMGNAANVLYDRGRELIEGLVRGMFSVNIPNPLDLIPGLPSFPKVPFNPGKAIPFAEGGIVTRPTFALVGEAGPEAVIPLNRGGVGGDVYITVNATGPLDEAKFARYVMSIVRGQSRMATI